MNHPRLGRRLLVPLFAGIAIVCGYFASAQGAADEDHHATLGRVALDASALQAGKPATLAVVLEVAAGHHAQSSTSTLFKYRVRMTDAPGLTFKDPIFPPGKDYHEGAEIYSVYTGKVITRIPIQVAADVKPGPITLTGALSYQVCDEATNVCYPPIRGEKFELVTTIVAADATVTRNAPELFQGPATEPTTRPTTGTATTGTATTGPPAAAVSRWPGAGGAATAITGDDGPIKILGLVLSPDSYVFAFAAAFLVGVIFNIMPCVLPVLPLKAMGFYEVSQHNRAKSISFGAVFSAGLIASFAALGLLVFVLHALNWGQLFTFVWFRLAIVAILLAMAASTLGLFTVNLPTGIYSFSPRHDTYFGNFLFGILTAALSTPCTFGMFVGLLTWASAHSAGIGMALLTMVGVGMASPYFVLSAFPEAARRFPRTGPGAELVKQLMGFLLIGMAIYFAKPFIDRFGRAATWWAMFGLVLAAGLFMIWRASQLFETRRPKIIVAVIALLAVVVSFAATKNVTYEPYQWRPYSDAALADARAGNRVVLVEFTASWCGNCQYLEARVLHRVEIVKAVADHDVLMLRADVTDDGAPGTPLLDTLIPKRAIPLTVIYSPRMPQPIKLTGIYDPAQLQDAIVRAAAGNAVARVE